MDQYTVNQDTKGQGASAAPAFIPQGPPRKLGVLRTIILILMIFVAAAEALLLGGVYLMYSLPGGILG